MRGKGITSRMCSVPQIQATVRSRPRPKPGMRDAAVAAQVEIPLEWLLGQLVFVEALNQQVVIVNALAATDNFAIAFGRKHVESERKIGTLGVGLHVERLDGGGIAVNHDRAVEFIGDDSFFVAADVFAKFRGVVMFVENLDGFFVADARERRFNVFELFGVALEGFEFDRFIREHGLHHGADQAFGEVHHIGQARRRRLPAPASRIP